MCVLSPVDDDTRLSTAIVLSSTRRASLSTPLQGKGCFAVRSDEGTAVTTTHGQFTIFVTSAVPADDMHYFLFLSLHEY